MAASAKDLRLHELKDSISQLNKRIDALLTALEAANAREAELRRERDTLKEQVDFLADLGCDMIQGYYFAKPMPKNEYEGRMQNNNNNNNTELEEKE